MGKRLSRVIALTGLLAGQALAAEDNGLVVRIAQLEIDPAQVAAYQAAVKEEISESTRVEPGVISIYAVAEVDRPNWFHFFEIYASDSAYRSHIESPHFKKYAVTTKSMILSKRLIETTPI
ncbi:antibiotic biosynthesis monooxygenase [Pseudomonas moraviensis]|uniref:Antibiotic biosynthesis monooxygenase n=2 Tax=Pseudomonas TaxID=286 RepID=A0A423NN32_9PSED|nr:antibiotic biosynthesis monooxygenase [Pseudomonas moraviensis]RON99628.1 antibiotic biosynthesis monooxygenase [Pseudomonas moraviensis]